MKGPTRATSRSRSATKSSHSALVTETTGKYDVSGAEPSIDVQRLLIRADFIKPLAGQHVVFAGRMQQISQEDAQQLAKRLGGQCHDAVTQQTDLVVIGAENSPSDTNQQTANALRETGQRIRILNEREFLSLVMTPSG